MVGARAEAAGTSERRNLGPPRPQSAETSGNCDQGLLETAGSECAPGSDRTARSRQGAAGSPPSASSPVSAPGGGGGEPRSRRSHTGSRKQALPRLVPVGQPDPGQGRDPPVRGAGIHLHLRSRSLGKSRQGRRLWRVVVGSGTETWTWCCQDVPGLAAEPFPGAQCWVLPSLRMRPGQDEAGAGVRLPPSLGTGTGSYDCSGMNEQGREGTKAAQP
jgi:hypothetical protein